MANEPDNEMRSDATVDGTADERRLSAANESRLRVGVFRVINNRTARRDPGRTRYHTDPQQNSEEFWHAWREKRDRMYAEFRRIYDERNRPYREYRRQLERKKEADRADRKVHLQEIREHIQSLGGEAAATIKPPLETMGDDGS